MNDAISRQDVLKALIERRNDIRAFIEKNKMPAEEASTYWCEIHGIYYAIDLIEAFPSTEKTGWWITNKFRYDCMCSNCGYSVYHKDAKYFCPNCGARMVGA